MLCVLLWAAEGRQPELTAYEDAVLALMPDHGARVVSRVRRIDDTDSPHEIHIIEFPDQQAMDAYLADPRRTALADQRERAVARTDVIRVTPV
jgi:uncharacterized protein (DUF1330 family)